MSENIMNAIYNGLTEGAAAAAAAAVIENNNNNNNNPSISDLAVEFVCLQKEKNIRLVQTSSLELGPSEEGEPQGGV